MEISLLQVLIIEINGQFGGKMYCGTPTQSLWVIIPCSYFVPPVRTVVSYVDDGLEQGDELLTNAGVTSDFDTR